MLRSRNSDHSRKSFLKQTQELRKYLMPTKKIGINTTNILNCYFSVSIEMKRRLCHFSRDILFNSYKPLKVEAINFFSSVYVTDTACFNECLLFHVSETLGEEKFHQVWKVEISDKVSNMTCL